MTKLNSTATYGPRGRDAEIVYSIVNTPLGRAMIAGTDRGICFIALGKSERELERELARDFPEARRRRDDDTTEPRSQPNTADISPTPRPPAT